MKNHSYTYSLNDLKEKVKGVWYFENWKWVVGYREYYKVSSFGRIKSIGRSIDFVNRWGRDCVRVTKDKIIKPNKTNKGYLRAALSKDGHTFHISVHRLVISAFRKNKNAHPEVNHEDGKKWNNRPNNLKWCNRIYNQRHARDTGLNVPKRGMNHHSAKKIHVILKNGHRKEYGSVVDAAIDLNISRSTAFNVLKSKKRIKIGAGKGVKLMYI